jgi:fructose-bisphosphate aldolase class II
LEHAEAIASAAERAGAACILQVSQNAVAFHHGRLGPIAAACAAVATSAAVPLSLHLDHVEDRELLEQAASHQFSSVMFDAGARPYSENVALTRSAAEWAHRHGLFIEAELGYVGGKASQPQSAHEKGVLTDPREAFEYVASTGVDALAVAVGSSHAMTQQTARLEHTRIQQLAEALSIPLVLHGSSGVPMPELIEAVAHGMVKINVGTALNVAFTSAVRASLAGSAGVDPRNYLRAAREAIENSLTPMLQELSVASS